MFVPVGDINLRLEQARGVDHAYWWGEDGLGAVEPELIIGRGSLSRGDSPAE
jgi:hypothetical protein